MRLERPHNLEGLRQDSYHAIGGCEKNVVRAGTDTGDVIILQGSVSVILSAERTSYLKDPRVLSIVLRLDFRDIEEVERLPLPDVSCRVYGAHTIGVQMSGPLQEGPISWLGCVLGQRSVEGRATAP